MPEAYAMPAAATAPLLTAARVQLPLLPLNSYSLHRQCTAALLTVARWTPFALSTGNAPHRLWHEPRRRGRACDGSNSGLPSRQPGRRWPHARLWRFARHCWVRHHHAGFSRLPQPSTAFHRFHRLLTRSIPFSSPSIVFHRLPSPSIPFHAGTTPPPCSPPPSAESTMATPTRRLRSPRAVRANSMRRRTAASAATRGRATPRSRLSAPSSLASSRSARSQRTRRLVGGR